MLIIAIKEEKHSKETQETLGAYKKHPTTNTKWIQLNSTNDTSSTHCVIRVHGVGLYAAKSDQG